MGAIRHQCTSAVLLFLFIPFVLAQQPADSPLKIDEPNVRFQLLPKPELQLPVVNLSRQRLGGTFLLELVNFDDQVHSTMKGTFQEEPGKTVEKLQWEAKTLPTTTPSELGWYRLRYTFTPSISGRDSAPVRGVLQMGPLISDAFELRLTGAATVGFGAKYPLRARGSGIPRKPENVIEAMIAAMPAGDETAGSSKAGIVVNGHIVSTLQLREATAIVGPATLELEQYLHPGHNTVQVVRGANSSAMNALVVSSHYIPWKDSPSTAGEKLYFRRYPRTSVESAIRSN
jgi:hypothetical protein